MMEETQESLTTIIKIGNSNFICSILNDGSRVIDMASLLFALRVKTGGIEFADAEKLIDIIQSESILPFLKHRSSYFLPYKVLKEGNEVYVYNSDVLVDIIELFKTVKKNGTLKDEHQLIYDRCRLIDKPKLSKIGLIDLIDRRLDYDYSFELELLRNVMVRFIHEDFAFLMERFPVGYYKEMFRLNKWGNFIPSEFANEKRIVLISKWTKDYVFKKLSKDVISQLREIGVSRTDDPHPYLELQLNTIITVMKLSKNWSEFERKYKDLVGETKIEFDTKVLDPVIEYTDFDLKLKQALDHNPNKGK